MMGTSQPAYTGFHPGSIFYDPNVERYDLDIEKANVILDEAGYAREVMVCASNLTLTLAGQLQIYGRICQATA